MIFCRYVFVSENYAAHAFQSRKEKSTKASLLLKISGNDLTPKSIMSASNMRYDHSGFNLSTITD